MDEKDELRRLRSASQLYEAMYADPEIKPVIQKWTEEKSPGVLGRVAAAQTVQQAEARLDAKIQEWEARQLETEGKRRRKENIAAIQSDPALRIRDDEVPEVENLMIDRKVGRYQDAAKLYRAEQQVAAPRASFSSFAMQVPGLNGAGGDSVSWLKPAFSNLGDRSVLDRVAREHADKIAFDFANGRGHLHE